MTASTARGWFAADERREDVAVATLTAAVGVALLVVSPQDNDAGWPDVAAGVGAFVVVVLRRRWPFALLGVAVGWSAVHVAIWDRPSVMVFAVFVLLATACIRLERGPAIALGAAVGAILYVLALIVNDDLAPGDGRVLIAVVWTAAAVGVADAVRSWRRYRRSAAAEVRAAVLAAEAQASRQVSEERLAIARELHDLLAHNLSVMNVQTGAALHLLRSDPDRAEASLVAARDAGRTVLDELRELLAVLRDDSEGGAPRTSLPTIDDVPDLVATLKAAGLAVAWAETGTRTSLAPAVSLAAYRIIQEALTNAAKHGAGVVSLTTDWGSAGLVITVTNPVPAAPGDGGISSGGLGLIGMRERAVSNGGALDVGPTESGFRVCARLPVAQDRPELDGNGVRP
jgi:signal transduction histidine kinase